MYDSLLLVYNGNNLSDYDSRMRFKQAVKDDNLREQDFTGADLRGVDMRAMELSGVSFAGANLSFVDAAGADFSGCNLCGTKFRNAHLRDAVLVGAEAIEADFTGAHLDDSVDLRFVDLRNAKADLKEVDRKNMIGAVLPWGESVL